MKPETAFFNTPNAEPSKELEIVKPLDSRSLFAGRKELQIVHGGKIYRLRITKQEKLILTK